MGRIEQADADDGEVHHQPPLVHGTDNKTRNLYASEVRIHSLCINFINNLVHNTPFLFAA